MRTAVRTETSAEQPEWAPQLSLLQHKSLRIVGNWIAPRASARTATRRRVVTGQIWVAGGRELDIGGATHIVSGNGAGCHAACPIIRALTGGTMKRALVLGWLIAA